LRPYNDPHLLNIVLMPQSHDQIVRERLRLHLSTESWDAMIPTEAPSSARTQPEVGIRAHSPERPRAELLVLATFRPWPTDLLNRPDRSAITKSRVVMSHFSKPPAVGDVADKLRVTGLHALPQRMDRDWVPFDGIDSRTSESSF
ncbi:MAG: hypothetical protein ABSF15_26240, partial [Candidatus Sulfotelmatobacter sp.]